jgi:predicted NAD/FAD-binding protein
MLKLDWKYVETLQKRMRINRVSLKECHVDAVDMDTGYALCLDADEKIDLGKIKKAKIYQATIKVYKADLTPELYNQLTEMAMEDIDRLRGLQAMKASGSKPTKFELASIK